MKIIIPLANFAGSTEHFEAETGILFQLTRLVNFGQLSTIQLIFTHGYSLLDDSYVAALHRTGVDIVDYSPQMAAIEAAFPRIVSKYRYWGRHGHRPLLLYEVISKDYKEQILIIDHHVVISDPDALIKSYSGLHGAMPVSVNIISIAHATWFTLYNELLLLEEKRDDSSDKNQIFPQYYHERPDWLIISKMIGESFKIIDGKHASVLSLDQLLSPNDSGKDDELSYKRDGHIDILGSKNINALYISDEILSHLGFWFWQHKIQNFVGFSAPPLAPGPTQLHSLLYVSVQKRDIIASISSLFRDRNRSATHPEISIFENPFLRANVYEYFFHQSDFREVIEYYRDEWMGRQGG